MGRRSQQRVGCSLGQRLTRNRDDDEEVDAIDLARGHESLTDFLHRQALSLHLGAEDTAALRFLIESLNDDGYLEESLQELAHSLAGDDLEEREELEQRFAIALKLLQSLEPVGVGARNLAECLQLQLRDLIRDAEDEGTTAAHINQLLLAQSIVRSPWTCWRGVICASWPACAVRVKRRCARPWP